MWIRGSGQPKSPSGGKGADYFFRDEVGNIFKDKALKGRNYEKGGRIEGDFYKYRSWC